MSYWNLRKKVLSFKLAIILIYLFPINVLALEKVVKSSDLSQLSKSELKEDLLDSEKYCLGPGDKILIDFIDLPEFSGIYTIGPTGNIYLPEIHKLNIEGLSIEGLAKYLKLNYSKILKSPEFNLKIVGYKPIKVSLAGELKNPGIYSVSSSYDLTADNNQKIDNNSSKVFNSSEYLEGSATNSSLAFPTLFDAIKISGGITLYSDLTNIEILRKQPIDFGGGYKKTTLNILPEITGENLLSSQNIRLMNGDIIKIKKSENIIIDQVSKAMRSNINPSEIIVYISGQSENNGPTRIFNGSSMNQAIASSGGKKIFSGKVKFYRFSSDGSVLTRTIKHNPRAKTGSYSNPILVDGDVIYISRSAIGFATEAISTITRPALGLFSLYNLVDTFSED